MPRQRDASELRRIGKRVAQARKERGFTQEQLAETVGIEPVSLSRLETGDRAMSLSTLTKIAQAIGVKPSDLVGDALMPVPRRNAEDAVLVRVFAGLSPRQRKMLIAIAQDLARANAVRMN